MTIQHPETILVVDDSAIMLALLTEALADAGYSRLLTAGNGVEACQILETETVSAIVSDWSMPQMDGLELLRHVRRHRKLRRVPFLMATAQGEKSQVLLARENGADYHLTKPFTSDEMAEALKMVLAGLKQGRERGEPGPLRRNRDGLPVLRVAYLPVTDHIVLAVLWEWLRTGQVRPAHFELEAERLSGWNQAENALERANVDISFILAPLAMDLYAYGAPLRLLSLAHRNGSSLVRARSGAGLPVADWYRRRSLAIPHQLSIQHVMAHEFLSGEGLRPGLGGNPRSDVILEVLPPTRMERALRDDPGLAGLIVAEPVGAMAVANGLADVEFVSGEVWNDHPCCAVVARTEPLDEAPEAFRELVALLVRAGKFVMAEPRETAALAVPFLDPSGKLGYQAEVLERSFTQPFGLRTDNLAPNQEEMSSIQKYMKELMGIGIPDDIDGFVDSSFIPSE